MSILYQKLKEIIPQWRNERTDLLRKCGNLSLGNVSVTQAFGGMRGVKGMICDTSVVEPEKGLIIRGHPLLEIKDLWPEETFYLLLTGEIPDETTRKELVADFNKRAYVPEYVWDILLAMPPDAHPMTMFSAGLLAMEYESVFRQKYDAGIPKTDYWIYILEDSLRVISAMPIIASWVYRLRFGKGDRINWIPGLDLGANLAHMLGIPDPDGSFADLMRLYMHFHSDHEGGNISANAAHTVASALSNPYYAVSSGVNGLAGPLHGLANQECLRWILNLIDHFDGIPTHKQIREFAFDTLKSGKVIPGYGHAVLRVTDPRFTGFHGFGSTHFPEDPVFKTVSHVFEVVPKVLQEYSEERVKAGKNPIANFWPNVDAGSGALLHYYGITEFSFYTVLFSVSRSIGMMAQMIWNRAVGTPITRPKSISMKYVRKLSVSS